MLITCATCAKTLVTGARFCDQCGAPVQETGVVLERFRARDLLSDLVAKMVVWRIERPDTFGVKLFEDYMKLGDYAQGVTDFDSFLTDRPPLQVTVIFPQSDDVSEVFDSFRASCGQNFLGYVQLEQALVMVSSDFERDLELPNGLQAIGDAIGGSIDVLLPGGPVVSAPKDHNFMFEESDEILKVLESAGLVTKRGLVPTRFEEIIKDTIDCSVFRFYPNPTDIDKFINVSIYVGVVPKGLFGFDEATNKATITDENWILEFSSLHLLPGDFQEQLKKFQVELGGNLTL